MELKKAKIIAITSSKGGVGKTIFITNLAGIYEKLGKKVLLIDLDLYTGSISTLLNIHSDKTIYNFCDDLSFNRHSDTNTYLTKYSDFIDVLPSCKDPRQGSKINTQLIEKVVYTYINNYDVILIDNSHLPLPSALLSLDLADIILYMMSNDPMDLANSKNALAIYSNIHQSKIKVILNNSFNLNKNYFSLYDIKDYLGHKLNYIMNSSMFIKNIDQYIMEGKILTLSDSLHFDNKKDLDWYLNLAKKLGDFDGKEE